MALIGMNRRVAVSVMLAAGVALWSAIAEAGAAPRVALVVGNGGYDPANISRLANPENDARLMARTLERVGFEVALETDAGQDAMKRAIKAFGKRLRGAGRDAVGLFYYAGHGVEAGGDNYLIPLGAEVESATDLETDSVPAQWVLSRMEEAGNRLNILILDACRNNPYEGRVRSGGRGLARIDAPSGSYIAYSAAPGQVAADGEGENSPYTLALSAALVEPGLKVEDVFKRVRVRVEDETGRRGRMQTPWESSSLRGDFYFVPPREADDGPGPVADGVREDAQEGLEGGGHAVTAQRMETEREFWVTIKGSEDPADFDDYLERYPGGVYESLARRRRDKLRTEADDAAFVRSDSKGTSAAYAEYLQSYPAGRHATEARERLEFATMLGRRFAADIVDDAGWTDLHYAAVMNLPTVAEALLDAGMAVDVRLEDDVTFSDHLIGTLVRLGVDFTYEEWRTRGQTPLLLAAMVNARETARLLVERGADLEARDTEHGFTPLQQAMHENSRDLAELLVARGADVNARYGSGYPMLLRPANFGRLWWLEFLLQHGVAIDAANHGGVTALMSATYGGELDAVKLLVGRGADIHSRDGAGQTALHHADYYSDIAQALISFGADVNVKDDSGDTPLDAALKSASYESEQGDAEREGRFLESAELLRRHGGRCATQC